MLSANLLKEARKRAGLSQTELGRRSGRTQSAIARWERGEVKPSLETLRELVGACNLYLGFDLFTPDDSYVWDIKQQLELKPEDRFLGMIETANNIWRTERSLKYSDKPERHRFDPLPVLNALDELKVDYVLIGSLAGSLRGSPLIPTDRKLVLVPDDDESNRSAIQEAINRFKAQVVKNDDAYSHIDPSDLWTIDLLSLTTEIKYKPVGTMGYSDLKKGAELFEVQAGLKVLTASTLDLLRISRAAVRPLEHSMVPALSTLLELEVDRSGKLTV